MPEAGVTGSAICKGRGKVGSGARRELWDLEVHALQRSQGRVLKPARVDVTWEGSEIGVAWRTCDRPLGRLVLVVEPAPATQG